MSRLLTPDICVIGAGSAGLVTAAGSSQLGATTVLIEAERMGGDCLNTGCGALQGPARRRPCRHGLSPGGRLRLTQPPPVVDFAKVQAHVQGVIEAIAPNDSKSASPGWACR